MKKTRLIALLAACVMLLTSCGGAQGGGEGKQEGSTSAEVPKTEQSTDRTGTCRGNLQRTKGLQRMDHFDGYL